MDSQPPKSTITATEGLPVISDDLLSQVGKLKLMFLWGSLRVLECVLCFTVDWNGL